MTDAYLNAVGTSVPPHDVHQSFLRFAATLLPDDRQRRLFARMADRSGITHRYSTIDTITDPAGAELDHDGFYRRGDFPSTKARMQRFEATALPLARDAIASLGSRLSGGFVASGITHLVVTSCTGFFAPGLDLQLVAALGLPSSVERTMVGFMGCYAAFNALKLARHIVRSEPSARVLLVNLELCTLHLQETADLEQILSFMVFADGCTASLVSADPHGLVLDRFHAELIPDTDPLITWHIGDLGFDMLLSGQVPGAIATGLGGNADRILGPGPAPSLWAVHPGGRSVLDAVAGALSLDADDLADSRAVLDKFGNMSSCTILFVLDRMLRAGLEPGTPGIAMGFGPGLVAETLRFRMA